MLKKSFLVLAGSLMIGGLANATELYNQDDITFSVGGYLRLGYESNSQSDKDMIGEARSNNNSRINFSGTRKITDTLSAFALTEWSINAYAETSNTPFLTSRLTYAGIKHNNFGSISVGKQWSVYSSVAGLTDTFANAGNANGIYDDMYGYGASGSFAGTGKANESAVYNFSSSIVDVGLQVQSPKDLTYNMPDSDIYLDFKRKYSIGAATILKPIEGLKLGVAANYAKIELQSAGEMTESFGFVVMDGYILESDRFSGTGGFSYDNARIHVAVTSAYQTNTALFDTYSLSQESKLGYKYSQAGSMVFVGNNLRVTVDPHDTLVRYKDYNYAVVGITHFLGEVLELSAEYKQDLRSDIDIKDSTNNKVSHKLSADIRYNF